MERFLLKWHFQRAMNRQQKARSAPSTSVQKMEVQGSACCTAATWPGRWSCVLRVLWRQAVPMQWSALCRISVPRILADGPGLSLLCARAGGCACGALSRASAFSSTVGRAACLLLLWQVQPTAWLLFAASSSQTLHNL